MQHNFVYTGLYAVFLRLGYFPRSVLSLSGVNILSSLLLYLLPFTLSLYASPFYSLSIYPFHLSLLSLPPSLISPSLSIYLLLPFSLSLLSIILSGVSNGRFRPCFLKNPNFATKYLYNLGSLSLSLSIKG